MQKTQALGVLVLVSLLAAAAWWLSSGRVAAPPGTASAPGSTEVGSTGTQATELDAGPGARSDDFGAREAVAAAANAPAASGAAIVGIVVDADGSPVADAVVQCAPSLAGIDWDELDFAEVQSRGPGYWAERTREAQRQRVSVTTGEDGAFRVAAPGSSPQLELRVLARGRQPLSRGVERPDGHDRDLGVLALLRGGVLAGRVVDRAGSPVEGARVTRRGRGGAFEGFELLLPDLDGVAASAGEESISDAEGRFELAHVPPGEASLRVRHVDHPLARLDGLTLAAGETRSDLVVVVEPGASISGRLLGAPAGATGLRVLAQQPRERGAGASDENAPFALLLGDAGGLGADGFGGGERSAEVERDGTFVLRGLHVGRGYRVWAVQSGRGFAGISPCSQRVDVASGATGLELRYEAGVTVTFTVVDRDTGAPIDRLSVRDRLAGGRQGIEDMIAFAPGGRRARHYPDGRVTIANLRPKPEQKLDLGLDALGYAPFERKAIELPTVGALDLGAIRLDPAPVVRVEVVASDGAPVAGATVRLREQRGERAGQQHVVWGLDGGAGLRSGKTDAAGRCELNADPGSEIVVGVTCADFAPYASDVVRVAERADTEHRAQLVRGGTVVVTVVEPDGAPVAEVEVERRGEAGGGGSVKTAADGTATFEHLAPGEHRFRVGGRARRGAIAQDGDFVFEAAGVALPAPGSSARPESGWETAVVADLSRVELRLARAPAARASGIVRENGKPLRGARVSFQAGPGDDGAAALRGRIAEVIGDVGGSSGATARTDEEGRYELKDLTAGEHRLRISHRERVSPAVVPIVLRAGDNTFDVDLDTAIVRGTVRDPDGVPVAGAAISVGRAGAGDTAESQVELAFVGALDAGVTFGSTGGRSRTRSDADGRYELRGVEAGREMVVRASAKGFAPATSVSVTPSAGRPIDGVDIVLLAAGSVRVRATLDTPFATVQATWDGPATDAVGPVVQMLRDGSALLEGLRPGSWKLSILAPAEAAGERRVEVAAGKVADVAF